MLNNIRGFQANQAPYKTARQVQQLATFVNNAETEFEAGNGAGLTKAP